MNPKFFGDSYDIVKQSLLNWLAGMGAWSTHPMFTEPITVEDATAFSQLLGTRLLSLDQITTKTDRVAYLTNVRDCRDHVFLDPDTGIRLKPCNTLNAPRYLFGPELVAIADARPENLTLVFDQSLARGKEREQIQKKMAAFAEHGILSIAYVSHASFILLGKDRSLLESGLKALRKKSHLPGSRFLSWRTTNKAL